MAVSNLRYLIENLLGRGLKEFLFLQVSPNESYTWLHDWESNSVDQ